MNRLFETAGVDPALNLALEEALLLMNPQAPQLFLWQNAHTVVIGRGQNAWQECRCALLREEGGTLVRRTTGGGAVYHDLGNLNFSFVMPKPVYDVQRQLQIIRRAVKAFGVETESSGRNDIVITGTGEKFSGNAFRHLGGASLHHGTILVSVDKQKLGRYLAPPREKLQAKGVASVRARVGNLIDHAPGMDITGLKQALFGAFEAEYGPSRFESVHNYTNSKLVEELAARNREWHWVYGRTPRFDITFSKRFAWGQAELQLCLHRGKVQEANCYSDANDPEIAARVSALLQGAGFTAVELAAPLTVDPTPEIREMAEWLAGLEI